MARRHDPDHPYMWRAVVTHTWPNGKTFALYYGPFTGKGSATSAGNRERNSYAGVSSTTVDIQRSPLVWQAVTSSTRERT